MSIFKKKNYIDMRCPRCGGRVYEKECSFYCENDEVNRDMSISHIALQYQIVKNIK